MKCINSYIFLPKDDDKDNHEKVERNIISRLCSLLKIKNKGKLEHDLSIRTNSSFISEDGKTYLIELKAIPVGGMIYLDVIIKSTSKDEAIKGLEIVDCVITNPINDFEKNKIMICSYDEISEHYCSKVYPQFQYFERLLRKLMLNIYTCHFCSEYFTKTNDDKIIREAKGIIKSKGVNKEIERLKFYMYSIDYSQIQTMLFGKRWTAFDDENINKFLSSNNDLTKLSDAELRKTISTIVIKSDWERFFADKFCIENIEGKIERVRQLRNEIAHSKFFRIDSFEESKILLDELISTVYKAIEISEEKDFSQKNREYQSELFKEVTQRILGITSMLSISMKPLIDLSSAISQSMLPDKGLGLGLATFMQTFSDLNSNILESDMSFDDKDINIPIQ